ncbi:unnamed protein product [Candidula unifasciata]|uniref:ABC transporter domain-containing protein n=1 Tax=Candidula unifasciata TaxID=100452 RepID=A0A8S3ZHG2_9EUPU|nr:unnamed protein product [Candidula unifasciata]
MEYSKKDDATLLTKQSAPSMDNKGHSVVQYGSFNPAFLEHETDAPDKLSAPVPQDQSEGTTSLDIVDLSYTIKEHPGHWWHGSCLRKSRLKTVLHSLYMTFTKGEITALIGSSGSGKTSLLDVISGRAQGEVSGLVTYKKELCTRDTMKQVSSYVLQADRLLPTLTVKETLTYMAYLKLPGQLTSSEIDAKVQSVIADMGLQHVAESRIGGAVVRGVSGGEKRRITIGVQLLKDPEILLLDEPTSGLDAFTARQLVSSLAQLAHRGKLVILTIHQPRSDIFNLLDKVAILTIGRLAFNGKPDHLVSYFTSIGYPCPRNQNPCDVYVDITSVDRRSPGVEKSTSKKVQKLCDAFANSDLQTSLVKRLSVGLTYRKSDGAENNVGSKNEMPPWTRKMQCLLKRMYIHLWRDRGAFLGRFLMLPFFVPFILIFLGRLNTEQESIQNRLGLIYQATQVTAYVGMTHSIALFPVLRELFYREYQDGLYSTFTFLLAYCLHCLPFNMVTVTVFSSIFYWSAGMNNNDTLSFAAFVLVCLILVQFGETLTAGILGVFRNVPLANNTTALVFSASGLLASGLLRAVTNMPDFLEWAGYIAIHKYAAEIVVANEFHNLNFTCSHHSQQETQCLTTGDQYLKLFYRDALDNMSRNFGILAGYSVGGFVLSVLLFKARGLPTLH